MGNGRQILPLIRKASTTHHSTDIYFNDFAFVCILFPDKSKNHKYEEEKHSIEIC